MTGDEQPACAHSIVRHKAIVMDGFTTDAYLCDGCGFNFIPVAQALANETRARAEAAQEMREHLGGCESWPVWDILDRLADAAEHLLGDHNCDSHGYEEVQHCRDLARDYAAKLQAAHCPPENERASK